ncbi:hypothetical protein ACFOD4_13330 [Pseudoroseomonas globiformis]|uniref:Uncharacterized protein n=1 Tax=Teichococcus globiformis TaxID=2307229 RepID=A0ABV7G074_9PROT
MVQPLSILRDFEAIEDKAKVAGNLPVHRIAGSGSAILAGPAYSGATVRMVSRIGSSPPSVEILPLPR